MCTSLPCISEFSFQAPDNYGCSDDPLPSLPEADAKILKSHLKQVLSSISIQPIKNFDDLSVETLAKLARQQQIDLESPTGGQSGLGRSGGMVHGANSCFPFLFGNDVDSVDIATRVAMVKFFDSPNVLADFQRHTRTLRLYPRPIVSIQVQQLLRTRSKLSPFMSALVSTQSVECFAEWSLLPSNLAFKNVMEEGIYDPIQVGDKAKWFAHHLLVKEHRLWTEDTNGLDKLKELLLKAEEKTGSISHGKDNADHGGNTDESQSSEEDSEEHLSSASLSSSEAADFAKNDEDGFASEEDMRPVSEELTSFPSDVSIAGSDQGQAIETSSEKSLPPPPLVMSTNTMTKPHPKPPTPTVTPRCSSPPSNIFGSLSNNNGNDNGTIGADPVAPCKEEPLPPTFEEVTAQELFLGIEQLTLQAKSLDLANKVQSFKSVSVAASAVNREKLSNVGRSVVDNFAASSKKLEFFKALANSTSPPPSNATTATKANAMASSHPKMDLANSNVTKTIEMKKETENNELNKKHDNDDSLEVISTQHEQAFSKTKLKTGTTTSHEDKGKGTKLDQKRPLSPKYDIAFPQSNLNDIATPRPSSRIPKKNYFNKATNDDNLLPLSSPASPSRVVVQEETNLQIDDSTKKALPKKTKEDFSAAGGGGEELEPRPSTLPRSSHLKVKETPSTRFLDEHHPGLTRSNSTLSNVSSYSQTTHEIFSSISSDLSGLATQTSSLLESMFGYSSTTTQGSESLRKRRSDPKWNKYAFSVSEENNISIKDAVDRVLLGEGVGWLKLNRLKRLMEEEMHRSLMLDYLQRKLGQHMTRDGHIEDSGLDRQVWKGLSRLISALIHGLETSLGFGVNASVSVGIASAFQLLELGISFYHYLLLSI